MPHVSAGTKTLYPRHTIRPLLIESPQAKKRVATGVPQALDDPFLVLTTFSNSS